MSESGGPSGPPSVPVGRRPPGMDDAPDQPQRPPGTGEMASGSWSPSAFGMTSLGHGFSPAGSRAASVRGRFSRDARSPLPELGVALATAVATYGLARWMNGEPATSQGGPSDAWTSLVDDPTLQLERAWDYIPGDRGWGVLAGLVVTAAAVGVLLRRIGVNAPVDARFGAGLALAGLLSWWSLPLALIDSPSTVDGSLARACFAFALLLVNIGLFRSWLARQVWRAGHLPMPLLTVLTWLPMLAGWAVLLAVEIWGLAELQADGPSGVEHRVTQAQIDWALRLNRASWASLVVLVVVVAVRQHLGISRDRQDLDQAEDQDHRAGIHARGELALQPDSPRLLGPQSRSQSRLTADNRAAP